MMGAASSFLGVGTVIFAMVAPILVHGQTAVARSPQACISRWQGNLGAPGHFSVIQVGAPNEWQLAAVVLVMCVPLLAAWRHASNGHIGWLVLLWATGLLFAIPGVIPGCNMVAFGPSSVFALVGAVLGTVAARAAGKAPDLTRTQNSTG